MASDNILGRVGQGLVDIGVNSQELRQRLRNPAQFRELDQRDAAQAAEERAAEQRANLGQQEVDLRRGELQQRQAERAAARALQQRQAAQAEAQRQAQISALLNPQVLGTISSRAGLPQEAVAGLIGSGNLEALGTVQKLTAPRPLSKIEEQLQTLQVLGSLPQDQQEQFSRLFGRGGTTVNVGGQDDPFQSKFRESLAKGRADQVGTLEQEAQDFRAQSLGNERALDILKSNPDLNVNPAAPITAQGLSLFSGILPDETLENISDFQQLNSQLIRNRFDVTKVLKGAITEQEQQAAQVVAGSLSGTRAGLEKTLANNIASSQIQEDYNQRKAQAIIEQGESFNNRAFNEEYKRLGETGERATLDSIVQSIQGDSPAQQLSDDDLMRIIQGGN